MVLWYVPAKALPRRDPHQSCAQIRIKNIFKDMVDLHEASKDLANFVRRNGIGPILRGATLSTSMSADAHYSAVVSNLSPLFKLPVDAVQRGRDHGAHSCGWTLVRNYSPARNCFHVVVAIKFPQRQHMLLCGVFTIRVVTVHFSGDIRQVYRRLREQ